MTDDLQEFARQLMRAVRDEAIWSCDNLLALDPRTPVGERWNNATDAVGRDAIQMAIPDIVDEVIFHFLNRGIDQGLLPLTFTRLMAPPSTSPTGARANLAAGS